MNTPQTCTAVFRAESGETRVPAVLVRQTPKCCFVKLAPPTQRRGVKLRPRVVRLRACDVELPAETGGGR